MISTCVSLHLSGNHTCVAVMNNFVPRAEVDYYTVPHGLEKEPRLPPFLAAPLHKFIMQVISLLVFWLVGISMIAPQFHFIRLVYLLQVNMNPVRVALNLHGVLLDHIDKVEKVLELMRDREARRGAETNEVTTFKFHYLFFVVAEIFQIQQRQQQQQSQMKLKEVCLMYSQSIFKTVIVNISMIFMLHYSFDLCSEFFC